MALLRPWVVVQKLSTERVVGPPTSGICTGSSKIKWAKCEAIVSSCRLVDVENVSLLCRPFAFTFSLKSLSPLGQSLIWQAPLLYYFSVAALGMGLAERCGPSSVPCKRSTWAECDLQMQIVSQQTVELICKVLLDPFYKESAH
jgi:hypothetical protein